MKGTTFQELKTMEKVHGSSMKNMKKTGKDLDKLKEIARQQGKVGFELEAHFANVVI